jgi:hypothetical protein
MLNGAYRSPAAAGCRPIWRHAYDSFCLPCSPVACGEEPQRLEAAQMPGANSDNWNTQLRERALNQSEAERIYR